MRGGDGSRGAAADGEVSYNGHRSRVQLGDAVVENLIHNGLVKDALVAEGKVVELQALHLDAFLVRRVGQRDGRKIGLAGDGADAGEFGEGEFDLVVALGARVVEGVEDRARVGELGVS